MSGNSKKKSKQLSEKQRKMGLYLDIGVPDNYRSAEMDAIFSECCPIVNKKNGAKIMEMELEEYQKKKLLELCGKWEAKKKKSFTPKPPNTPRPLTKRQELAMKKRNRKKAFQSNLGGNS